MSWICPGSSADQAASGALVEPRIQARLVEGLGNRDERNNGSSKGNIAPTSPTSPTPKNPSLRDLKNLEDISDIYLFSSLEKI